MSNGSDNSHPNLWLRELIMIWEGKRRTLPIEKEKRRKGEL
jgi:hypothetical protein